MDDDDVIINGNLTTDELLSLSFNSCSGIASSSFSSDINVTIDNIEYSVSKLISEFQQMKDRIKKIENLEFVLDMAEYDRASKNCQHVIEFRSNENIIITYCHNCGKIIDVRKIK